MSRLSYSEKLKDPRWQRKRLEILDRDEFACQRCFSIDKTLHVDHGFYDSREPWEYPDETLTTYCEDCHSEVHRLRGLIKDALATARPDDIEFVLGALAARLGTGHVPESHDWADGYGAADIAKYLDVGTYALVKLGVWQAMPSLTEYLLEPTARGRVRVLDIRDRYLAEEQ